MATATPLPFGDRVRHPVNFEFLGAGPCNRTRLRLRRGNGTGKFCGAADCAANTSDGSGRSRGSNKYSPADTFVLAVGTI